MIADDEGLVTHIDIRERHWCLICDTEYMDEETAEKCCEELEEEYESI